MDEGEEKCMADIKEFGCHLIHVLAEAKLPPFTYSVGIQHASRAPELIIVGLKRDLSKFMVNEYNRRVREGERFKAGDIASGFIEGFDCQFRPVHQSQYKEYFGWDLWLYRGPYFDALQLVFPTTAGVWPWDPEATDSFRDYQPLLEFELPTTND